MAAISFTLNARAVEITADGDTPLLDVLRNHLGLTGTRFGCGLEQCGSCMVLIDGQPDAAIIAGRLSICSNTPQKVMLAKKRMDAASGPGADGLYSARNLTS
jgi:aerobic-type carbon monoxide dehydrogenase small subunit (CoxS/CutS family)